MTGHDLEQFRERFGFKSMRAAAAAFSIRPETWAGYEYDKHPIPLTLRYALSAYAFGLPPYPAATDLVSAD